MIKRYPMYKIKNIIFYTYFLTGTITHTEA